jgi:hypothetical protein
MSNRAFLATLALAAAPLSGAGQGVAGRVEAVGDGVARITYPVRPDVEICDQGIRMGDRRLWWRSDGWDRAGTSCRTGTVEVELRVRRGQVRDVEVLRRRGDRHPDAVDLGTVTAEEAARYLLDVARAGMSGVEEAVFPAVLADVDELWRDLLSMAQDRDVGRDVRRSALFWVGQEAASAATEGLADVAFDEDEEQDVRDAAVFALSQRPSDEGVPILMELARTAREAKTRRTAMFWLAQSEDDRVIAFFEEILVGRRGG